MQNGVDNKYIIPVKLKCNQQRNPIGVDTDLPALSWELEAEGRAQFQKAYRIIVSDSLNNLDNDFGNIWDSGKVCSEQSIHIPYGGARLKSAQRYYWKVCVWGNDDSSKICSKTAYWEMGLLNKNDWKGKWISGTPYDHGKFRSFEASPSPLLRKIFYLQDKVKDARAYICGLGYFELYINGEKVSDDVLNPAFTRYDKRVLYVTYDVTGYLKQGENAVGVILGNGWYNSFSDCVWNFKTAEWRHIPKLLFQINGLSENGETFLITSNDTWKAADGPIIFDSVRNGEFYDARLEKTGWCESGFDDSSWRKASYIAPPGGKLCSQQIPPIKVSRELKPVSVKETRQGVFVFDFGQNLAGWCRLKVLGASGTQITIRYAEKLDDCGNLDRSNIDMFVKSGEFQTDKYTLKGEGVEIWNPRFTYHGFRYAEVTGFPHTPDFDSLTACFLHTSFEKSGSFSCDNKLFNKIQECTVWSSLGNYHGALTDCPHREKNAWTGDAHLSSEQLLLNFNPSLAFRKWMDDFRDAQRDSGQLPCIIPTGGWGYNWGSGPAWDSALILIPWYVYIYTGDISLIQDNYENMKKYVSYLCGMSKEYIVEFGLGDWAPPGGNKSMKCPIAVTDTAYFYVDTKILSRAAALLSKNIESEYYDKLAEDIKNGFRRKFLGSNALSCQTSIACAIYQGLLSGDELSSFAERLVLEIDKKNGHIDCGILGSKYILFALTQNGHADTAYTMASKKTYPSWGYWIENGATTLWESWEGDKSLNHHMFSDISRWFYQGLAGIYPDIENPGFKHIIIRPNLVGNLKWVKAWHKSPYGIIKCEWEKSENEFELNVTIPVNCIAEIHIPAYKKDAIYESEIPISENQYVKVLETSNDTTKLNAGSGCYRFISKI